mmetsp:Transcript_1790/g.5058  ORF Transcript_1790/g.5058 Transcript_1790/m.5058 type:complete len:119 (+) Transcript_1790:782-1138(+)
MPKLEVNRLKSHAEAVERSKGKEEPKPIRRSADQAQAVKTKEKKEKTEKEHVQIAVSPGGKSISWTLAGAKKKARQNGRNKKKIFFNFNKDEDKENNSVLGPRLDDASAMILSPPKRK